jgi:hypothetical protein
LYEQNNGQRLPARFHFSQRDYFLKTAKVFGGDIPAVMQIFEKSGYRGHILNKEQNSLEFHVNQISSLKTLNIEVGIASHVLEMRDAEPILRELKVDVTTPQTFRLSKDI